MAQSHSRRDLYAEVTQTVIDALEAGTVPWQKPWRELGLQRNLQSGRAYRGINQLLLQIRQQTRAYASPYWTTYRAAAKAGGNVRRGEKGTLVTFWKFIEAREEERPEEPPRRLPFLRSYTVFNTDQTEGLELPAIEELAAFTSIERAQ